jgi:RHS repeat-associated protein
VFGAPTIYAPNWISRSATLYDNRFLFTGREYAATYRSTYTTAAFNFYEYRARAYNAKLGRFMSEDPKLFDAGDYNLFRYCHNDPVDNVDPMGLADERREPWYNHEEQAKQLAKLQTLLNQKLLLGYGAISVGGLQYALTQLQQTMGGMANFHMAQLTRGNADPRPLKEYSTWRDAGRAGVTGDYEGVKMDQGANEYGNWILQQNGVRSGHYAFVPGIPGKVQYVRELRQKMQTTTLDPKNIPPGYHAVGWHYAQVRHADYVPVFDRQIADKHGWVVVLRVPGGGGNWERPNTFFYPPGD